MNPRSTYVPVKVKKLRPTAQLPAYGSSEAAGADLHSVESVRVGPGCRALVKTGIAIELPVGYEAQVRPRSGLALKNGITVLNTPGTVDSDYRGEVGVILFNSSNTNFIVAAGDRIAQLVIAPVNQATFREVEKLDDSERGAGGFGSTGVSS
jgi:dUTP pyrophosphatase